MKRIELNKHEMNNVVGGSHFWDDLKKAALEALVAVADLCNELVGGDFDDITGPQI